MLTSIASSESTLPNGVASEDTTPPATVLWTRSIKLGTVLFESRGDAIAILAPALSSY